jgi:hypothetical protein
MPSIPLAKAAYQRSQLPALTLKNYYYEPSPTTLEDQVSLKPRWRLNQFAAVGAGPINGLYRKGGVMADSGHSGAIICLSNATLYLVDQTTGAATVLGAVTAGGLRMSAEGNTAVVVLTTGGQPYYTDGNTLTAISFPDGKSVTAIDTLDSYFLFASELGRFYWSAVGGTTVDPLDYATAESQPDVLMSLKVIGDELWLFGRLSIEVWQPTGDLNLPFQRITGRIFGIGVTARDTIQKLNVGGVDTVCWVGTDRRVYRTNPNPDRISDPAIEEKLRKTTFANVANPSNSQNPYATTCSWDGHDFYILHIPNYGSWAYDLGTGDWVEWTSFNHAHFRGAVGCVGVNSQPLIGDDTSNVIWQMLDTQTLDGTTDPVGYEFSGLLEVTGPRTRCNNVMLALSGGSTTDPTSDPMMQMSWSPDGGKTFVDEDPQSLGREGEFNARVVWPRLGMLQYPGRVFRWRTTEPVTVRGAHYNESLAR